MAEKKKKKNTELTPMQAKFIKILQKKIANGEKIESLAQIGREAGYSEKSLHNIGVNVVSRCEKMKDALEQAGISKEYLAGKLKEGLNAYTRIAKKTGEITKRGKNGSYNKQIIYEDVINPDFGTRIRTVDLTTKLTGDQVQRVEHDMPFLSKMPVNIDEKEQSRISAELGILKIKVERG